MKKRCFPIAYIIAIVVGFIMLGLTVWQFTLPETNPEIVMAILCGGGVAAFFPIALHKVNTSYMPFSAASVPLGILLAWCAVVFLGCGIWDALLEQELIPLIPTGTAAIIFGILSYFMLKN